MARKPYSHDNPPFGWKCVTGPTHGPNEPCGLIPCWWNLRDRWRFRKNL